MIAPINNGQVVFVGAGPGDPELLTVKGRRVLESADVVIYAGSLVPTEIVALSPAEALKYDSATMTLEQIHIIMRDHARSGQKVIRLQTGDPSLYGALAEQIALLDADHIPWSIVPGVTSAMAAAAAAGISFSVPEAVQTLVLTRVGGRTPMPEDLDELAAQGVSMAIYLGGGGGAELQKKLEKRLALDTPVICAHRVGWPDEAICHTTLANLEKCIAENNFARQTMILILPGHLRPGGKSRLYDADFNHGFRQ